MDVIEVLKAKTDGMPDEVVITLTTQQGKTLLDQLEAERQRADAICRDIRIQANDLKSAQTVNKVLQAELAALKGDQVPVYQMYYDGFWRDVDKENYEHFKEKGSDVRLLFTAPQKPVVLPGISELIDACDCTPAVRDVHVWDLAISEVKRLNPSIFSEISAAGGIVKDGD